MFELVLTENTARTRRPLAVALSLAGQTLFAGLAVLVPMLHPETVSTFAPRIGVLTAPRPLGDPNPPRPQKSEPRGSAHVTTAPRPVFQQPVLRQPATVPAVIAADAPPAMIPTSPGTPGAAGFQDGVPGAMAADVIDVPRIIAPKPVPQPAAAHPARLRVGGVVQAAKLLRQVTPVYPPLARQARISGVVRLEAVIGRDGAIQSLQATSGHPLLTGAALEAVRQWLYRPTLLNGEPVEVLTQIEVQFKLGE